uniref:Secreted protein n=1 Tax=Ixodes ricinus TaxID=34613 RepID=A0A6B0URG3_IXORI
MASATLLFQFHFFGVVVDADIRAHAGQGALVAEDGLVWHHLLGLQGCGLAGAVAVREHHQHHQVARGHRLDYELLVAAAVAALGELALDWLGLHGLHLVQVNLHVARPRPRLARDRDRLLRRVVPVVAVVA